MYIKYQAESWKYNVQQGIFDTIRGVWIADETLSRVFATSSRSKQQQGVNWEASRQNLC